MAKAEIKPHFLKSIREIDGDIVELQNSITPIQNDIKRLLDIRSGIVELYGADTEIPPAPGAEPAEAARPENKNGRTPPRSEKQKRKYTRRSPAATSAVEDSAEPKDAGATGSRTQSDEALALLAVARKLPEPITAAALAEKGNVDMKFAANRIMNWIAKGWLKRSARGEYTRADQFPEE
jgi:hypothetical protein